MHPYRAFSICILLAAASCDDDLDVTAENVHVAMAKIACSNMYQCCSLGEIEDILGIGHPRTQDECVADLSKILARRIDPLNRAIAQGRMHFDAERMKDCLEARVAPSDSCTAEADVLPWAEACMGSAWIGETPEGGPCSSSLECLSTSFCSSSLVCTPFAQNGEACMTRRCGSDLFCDGAVCQTRRTIGTECTSSSQCQPDLFCDIEAVVPRCLPINGPAEACSADSGCTSGTCLPGACSDTGVSCTRNSQCGGGVCSNSGKSCEFSSDCAPGTCTVSGLPCSEFSLCPPNDSCLIPDVCNTGTCEGNACAAEAVDYCQDTLDDLPVPSSGEP